MSQKGSGYIEIKPSLGPIIYLHWTFPFGGIVVCGFFGGSLEQLVFYVLSFSLLIFVHEIGHLIAAKSFNLKVHGIKITGAGGMCDCEKPTTFWAAFSLYSGGLIAQVVAFAITASYIELLGYPSSKFGISFVQTFVVVNIAMFVINLYPSKSSNGEVTDGYVLWQLVKIWREHA